MPMRRSVILRTTVGLFVVTSASLAAIALARTHGDQVGREAASAASVTPSSHTPSPMSAEPGPPPPPFPAAAHSSQPTGFFADTKATRPLPCGGGNNHGEIAATPGEGWPATLKALYAQSDLVVVATAAQQIGFWEKRPESTSSGPPVFREYRARTTTNLHVTRVIKGTAVPWVQITDEGALSSEISTCPNLTYQVSNEPLPALGQQYILFLQHTVPGTTTAEGATLFDKYASWDRFPILSDSMVHSERDVHPAAVALSLQPESLEAFIASLN